MTSLKVKTSASYNPKEQRIPPGIWQRSSIIHVLHMKRRNAQRWTNLSSCCFEVRADVISHDSALGCFASGFYTLTHIPYALSLYIIPLMVLLNKQGIYQTFITISANDQAALNGRVDLRSRCGTFHEGPTHFPHQWK